MGASRLTVLLVRAAAHAAAGDDATGWPSSADMTIYYERSWNASPTVVAHDSTNDAELLASALALRTMTNMAHL